MYLGTEASGWVHHYTTKDVIDPVTKAETRVTDWTRFWLLPCLGAFLCLVLFIAFFRSAATTPAKPASPAAVEQGEILMEGDAN
jgi:hypothetical protein